MKRRFLTIISVLTIAILSACGPAATPTLSVADVQGTAVAQAWLAMTMTQLAMPTATQTPIPLTPTATFTPAPALVLIPTLEPPTLVGTPATNPCYEPPPAKPLGTVVQVKLVNKTNSSLNLSLTMQQENSLKECGAYSFTLSRYDEPVVKLLAGCYWGMAWVTDPPSTAKTPNNICVTDTSKVVSIWISAEVIGFH